MSLLTFYKLIMGGAYFVYIRRGQRGYLDVWEGILKFHWFGFKTLIWGVVLIPSSVLLISGQRGDLDFTSILYLCILFYSIESVYRVIHIDTGIVPV